MSGSSSKGRASSACASHRRRTGTDSRSRCQRLLWRARQESNLRPSAPEADALSAELQARGRAPSRRREPGLYSLRTSAPRKRRSGSRRSRLECCPGEGSTGYPIVFCRVTRASITPAAPTTLTLPTHDPVTRAAASLARRPLLYSVGTLAPRVFVRLRINISQHSASVVVEGCEVARRGPHRGWWRPPGGPPRSCLVDGDRGHRDRRFREVVAIARGSSDRVDHVHPAQHRAEACVL